MSIKSLREYEDGLKRQARRAFEKHDRLKQVGHGHWKVWSEADSCHFWYEVVVLANTAVCVWGDIAGVIFAYGGGKGHDPEQVVRWIAGSGLSYAREKAAIGMGSIGDTTDDDEVATWELYQYLKDRAEEGEGFVDTKLGTEDYEVARAIDMLENGQGVQMARHHLYDHGVDCEFVSQLGVVVSPRVVYALEAVNRLVKMLDRWEETKEAVEDDRGDEEGDAEGGDVAAGGDGPEAGGAHRGDPSAVQARADHPESEGEGRDESP
jgi:hypothetical protein